MPISMSQDYLPTPTTAASLGNASQSDKDFAREYTSGADRPGMSVLGSLAMVPTDLVDTVVSSVSSVPRGAVNNAALSAIGKPGLMSFYDKNRGAIELGSGIAGIVAADIAAGEILVPASAAMGVLRTIPYVKRIATLDKQYQSAVRLAQMTTESLAARGAIGVEQFVGTASFARLGAPALEVTAAQARNGVKAASVLKGLARNVTTEAVMGATLNQNSFLYSEDASENMAWMALGLGVGAGIDALRSRYVLSKMANSDKVSRLFQGAYDVTGKEADRLRAASDWISATTPDAPQSWLGYGHGVVSDRVTSMLLNARELGNRELPGRSTFGKLLGKNREALATPMLEQAFEEANKLTTKGIAGVSGTSFHYGTGGVGNGWKDALYSEPATLYGVENAGVPNRELGIWNTHVERQRKLDERLDKVTQVLSDGGVWKRTKYKTKEHGEVFSDTLKPLDEAAQESLTQEYRQLVFHNSLSAHIMLDPGEWQPIQMGKVVEGFTPAEIMFERSEAGGAKGIWQRKPEKGVASLGLSHTGDLFLPAGKSIDSLDFYDHLHLFHAADKMTTDMANVGEKMMLPQKPNWFQLDTAEQLIRKNGGKDDLIQWPPGLTRETAQIESLAQKVDAIRKKTIGKKSMAALTLEDAFKMRVQFNLPRLTSYQSGLLGQMEHPIETLLNGAKNGDAIRALSKQEVMQGLDEARRIDGLSEATPASPDELMGNSFNFMRDRDGNPMQPILGYKRPFAPFEWGQDRLAERLAVGKLMVREGLTNAAAAPLTKGISNALLSDPNFIQASRVQGLQDAQIQSAVPGFANAAPQTARGGILNSLVQKEWRDRDNPILLAASRLKETADRLTRAAMQQIIETNMGDVISRVNGPRSQSSKLLLNQFFTHRTGWELKQSTRIVDLPGGKKGYAFTIDAENEANRKRYQQIFGEELPTNKPTGLRDSDGREVVLDELGMEALQRFNQVSDQIRNEKNTLLRAQALPEINGAPFYTPPPNTKGKYIGFTFDVSDNLVPGGTITAATPEEFARQEAKLRESEFFKEGFTFRTRDRVANFMDLWDKAQMDWMQPTTTAIQPGKKAVGATAGREINANAFDEAMTWMRDSYLQHGNDMVATLMKDQINAAKARSAVAGVESRVSAGNSDLRGRSIYDYYIENVTGRSALSAPDSFFGDITNPLVKWANAGLREAAPHVSRTYDMLKDFLSNSRPGHDTASKEKFNRLSEALGQYMPFKNAAEMVANQTGAKLPPDLGAITGKMSKFEAAMRLRWFESMHAVVNLAGIVNAMPAVIRSVQKLPGESADDFARRVGHVANIFDLPDGKQIGTFDMMKIAATSMKDAWGKGADDFTRKAMARGYLNQEVAEFNRQFGAIDSKSKLNGFLFGDKFAESEGKSVFGKAREKVARSGGIDHWIGIISDKSEDFSRAWGMYAGKRIAEHLGITNVEHQLSFAHDMTNKMIANYDPRNRPTVFQGPLGAPIGLFQSYIYNYYQRMFRYVETKNTRALATQYAMQGAIFGVGTVPGWNLANSMFFDRDNGDGDPIDSLHHRLGRSAGDLIMNGTLSNLPKLFGVDGVNLYSRGDTSVRLPGFNPPAMFDTARRLVQGFSEGIAAFSGDNPHVSTQQLAEIASNMLTNRPLAGLIETFGAGGYDTDSYGRVTAQSRSLADKVYRVIGIRSEQQQQELEAFYANRNAQEQQNGRKTTLRESTRASIRAGKYDQIPDYFAKYVEYGGDPRYYTRWVKDAYQTAITTRGQQQLDEVLGDDKQMNYVSRLLDANVGVYEGDNETEDYGARAYQESQMNDHLSVLPDMPPELTNPTRAQEGADLFNNDSLFQQSL